MYDKTDIGEAAVNPNGAQPNGILHYFIIILLLGLKLEDITIDDNLPDLERVKKYVGSEIDAQRFAHVRMIFDTCVAVGYDTSKDEIFSLFNKIVSDEQAIIRAQFAIELEHLASEFLSKHADFLPIILDNITKLTQDDNAEVRANASDAFLVVFDNVSKDSLSYNVLPIVLQLAHNDSNTEVRTTAISILGRLSSTLLKKNDIELFDLLNQFVIPEICALSEDSVFQVRRAVAMSLAPCIRCNPSLLFQILRNLASDKLWGVRKACAISLGNIAAEFEKEDKNDLIPICEALLNDETRWVRDAMIASLGNFLSHLDRISDSLLNSFGEAGGEAADSLADVATIVGAEKWNKLDSLALRLATDSDWVVRAKLANGLGKIVKVAGPERMCVIINVLRGDRRANWRLRLAVAEQLKDLLSVFDVENAWSVLAPLCFNLLDDPVKVVGKVAMHSLGSLLLKFQGEKRNQIEHSLLERNNRRKYGFDVRQQFVWVIAALREDLNESEFKSRFIPALLELTDDPVPNVRIALATVLRSPSFQNLKSSDIELARQKLSKDTDKDVNKTSFSTTAHTPLSTMF